MKPRLGVDLLVMGGIRLIGELNPNRDSAQPKHLPFFATFGSEPC